MSAIELHPGEDLIDGVTFEMFLERLNNHPRCQINYDPSHFVLQQLDYLDFIDIYHERICAFHVKDAEFNPTGRQGVYSGFQPWIKRAGRFRSLGDGQVDFGGVFSKLAQYNYDSWAVLEWECCIKDAEQGAAEGAPFIESHIIKTTAKSFDDFAAGDKDTIEGPAHAGAGLIRHPGEGPSFGRLKLDPGLRRGDAGRAQGRDIMVSGRATPTRAASGSAWWAAGRGPSSAPCTASPRAWTTSMSSWRAHSPPMRRRRRPQVRNWALRPTASIPTSAEMAKAEAKRADGIEAVSIVTPNHVHVPAAMAFIEAGIHVICDKPLALNLKEAKALEKLLAKNPGVIFALTHNYSGYPMIRQAKAMVKAGELGDIRVVQGEYPQDWLTTALEKTGQKQAAWRTDPKRSGAGGCVGDIGTHTFQLLCDVSGLACEELSADLTSFVKGRVLDDNAHVMLRFTGGAKGMIWASQVAPGNENGLKIRVYGTKGGLEWKQEDPNYLWYTPFGEPKRLITRGGAGSNAAAGRMTRVPPGHPEGYLEGFANVYSEVARAIKAKRAGKKPDKDVAFPGIADGVAGMAFIEACVKSSEKNGKWTRL
jgi:predicted dehydrogenase